jgi:hypothetical protein
LVAAFRAISLRLRLDKAAARAFPPRLPSSAAALFTGSGVSSISLVAILPTKTAAPIINQRWKIGARQARYNNKGKF